MSDALGHALKGDRGAIALVRNIALTLDSRWRLDDRQALHAAAWAALVEIPSNPFYRRHEATLRPLMRQMLGDIQTAGDLANDGPHGQTLAFVLRDALIGFIQQCALLIGGYAWMREAGPAVRRTFHQEDLSSYLDRLNGPMAKPSLPAIDVQAATKRELCDYAAKHLGVALNSRVRVDDMRAELQGLLEAAHETA